MAIDKIFSCLVTLKLSFLLVSVRTEEMAPRRAATPPRGAPINYNNYIITIEKRAKVLKGEEACWLAKKRQTRRHAFSEETRKLVQDVWAHSVSRPIGNKNDAMRNHVQRKV